VGVGCSREGTAARGSGGLIAIKNRKAVWSERWDRERSRRYKATCGPTGKATDVPLLPVCIWLVSRGLLVVRPRIPPASRRCAWMSAESFRRGDITNAWRSRLRRSTFALRWTSRATAGRLTGLSRTGD